MSVTASDNRRRDDRRLRHGLRYPERRTGFDRREPDGYAPAAIYHRMLVRLRENPRTVLLILVLVTVLNFADLVFTQRALVRGAVEVNPIMRFLFDLHPVWAAVVKASIGMVVVEIIWALRRYRSALVLAMFSCIGMAALFAYHLVTQKIVPI